MAEEVPTNQSPTLTRSESGSDLESTQYWCYNCNKRVAIETLADLPNGVVCYECKDGFVESIAAAAVPYRAAAAAVVGDTVDDHQFIQMLRRIVQAARDGDTPPPRASHAALDEENLRFELDGWEWDHENDDDEEDHENDEEDEEEDHDQHSVEVVDEDYEDEEEDDEHSVEVVHEEEAGNRGDERENGRSDGEYEVNIGMVEPRSEDDGEEDEVRRRRREVLRLRISDFASRATSRRNRILDWAEILMGLEELQILEPATYVGNPGDYVDAAGYEALLQNLAESDSTGRRGAPPAAKAAVEGLQSVVIKKEDNIIACAICKDLVNVGEIAKNLPCGHGYHAECIVPWLGSRNSCPVCRFELPTDDLEYEEERRKRTAGMGLSAASSGSSGSGSRSYGVE